MIRQHHYAALVEWSASQGSNTTSYQDYNRNHTAKIAGKATATLTADTAFLGDRNVHTPEDALLMALSSCHLLTYLAMASQNEIQVLEYSDNVTGIMLQNGNGGYFTEVTLNPEVIIAAGNDIEFAKSLHSAANKDCFIANSVNFPVRHNPVIKTR